MARRKRGRPRSAGKLKKCPRCGRLGYPVVKTHTRTVKGKTYTWKALYYQHYSPERFRAGRSRMETHHIPKAKA